jgi:nucleoside-diphosphate-sugar epimerase
VAAFMITIVGGTGFVGTHLVAELKRNNIVFQLLNRDTDVTLDRNLGKVVYCAGYGGCDQDPFNVLHANAVLLGKLLKDFTIEKIIYLSSTRVYLGGEYSTENSDITIVQSDSRKLFNLSKIVAEELIIKSKVPFVILRPSNIYGDAFESPLFLPSIVRDSLIKGEVRMFITPDYSKDYVSVFDLVKAITISLSNTDIQNLTVNVASGENVSAKQIADSLIQETNCNVIWRGKVTDDVFPETDITLMQNVFEIMPRKVLDDLPKMISSFKEKLNK